MNFSWSVGPAPAYSTPLQLSTEEYGYFMLNTLENPSLDILLSIMLIKTCILVTNSSCLLYTSDAADE